MNLSTYALAALTATLGVATTSAVDVPCPTESDCRAAAEEAGITQFYADIPNETKGCYIKVGKNKAFYTPGGSVSQIWANRLPGIQARLWCEGPESNGQGRDGYDGGYSSDMLSNEEWLQGELKVDNDWDYDQNDPPAEDMVNSGSAIPFRVGVITVAVLGIVSSL